MSAFEEQVFTCGLPLPKELLEFFFWTLRRVCRMCEVPTYIAGLGLSGLLGSVDDEEVIRRSACGMRSWEAGKVRDAQEVLIPVMVGAPSPGRDWVLLR